MAKYYYKKSQSFTKRKILRLISLGLFLTGASIVIYVFFPLLSWQIYFAPVFASQSVTAPIPQSTVVSGTTLGSLIQNASNSLLGMDDTNAKIGFLIWNFKNQARPKFPAIQFLFRN